MKNTKAYVTAFCGVCVAMNLVLGIITAALGIPLYLDTLGTVLTAVLFGPVPGMIVGALSNIIHGLIYSVTDIPFALVNMAVGLVVGLVAKKFKFTLVTALITGLVKAGQNIFAAGFITKIGSNLIDKVGTCLVAYFLLKAMPARFLSMFKGE